MAAELSTADAVKQEARRAMLVAADKTRLASLALSRPDTMELDVAIVKATSSAFHVVPKEKHVRTLKAAVSARSPRGTVAYVNSELRARLAAATDWVTALKTLMVFHRLMRESDASYLDDLLRLKGPPGGGGGGGHPAAMQRRPGNPTAPAAAPRFGLDGWVDSVNIAGRFEGSAFARAYARYLDETLDVYESINFYLGGGGPDGGGGGGGGGGAAAASRLRSLAGPDLLFQLPRLQRLLLRLADCVPAGPAAGDPIVQAACLAVAQESFRAYRAASEGLINLADRFFDMDAADAARGADAYRQAAAVTARLQAFYRAAEGMPGLAASLQFPRLEPPPPDFVAQMEAYIREGGAPAPLGEAAPGAAPAPAPAPAAAAAGAAPAPAAAPATLPPPPAAARTVGAGLPLRRGTRAPPPSILTTGAAAARVGGPGGVAVPRPAAPASPATPAAAIIPAAATAAAPPPAPAGPPPVDALLDLLGESVGGGGGGGPQQPGAGGEAAEAWQSDPFASAPPPAAAPAPAPAAAPAAPAPLPSMGANPFGDATALAPPIAPAAAPAAPAAPAVAPASPAALSPPRPPAPAAEPADPFKDLLGGLSLGPSPSSAPPLRKAAPPAGAPMAADRAARFAAAAGVLGGGSGPAAASPPPATATAGNGAGAANPSPWS